MVPGQVLPSSPWFPESPRPTRSGHGSSPRCVDASDGGLRLGSIGLEELVPRHAGEVGPELLGCIEVEIIVQVQGDAKAALVNDEEPADPRAEEPDQLGIRVGERDLVFALRALAGGETETSRTQRDTDDFATPNSAAMSANVHDLARSSRARSCSRIFPPQPISAR